MTIRKQTKPEIKKPENLDLKNGEAIMKRVIQENKAWLKEMANK